MSAYFDTGLVTKWYVPEADSAAAVRLRSRFAPPAWITPLHRIELASAWNLKVFRKELRADAVAAAMGDFEADLATGLFRVAAISMDEVCATGERLALAHAARLGTRSLDTLHVAAALLVGTTDFVTGDDRQAMLAQQVNLKVTRLRPRR